MADLLNKIVAGVKEAAALTGGGIASTQRVDLAGGHIHLDVPVHANGRVGYHVFGHAYINPAQFQMEALLILSALAYLGVYLVARHRNRSLAYTWTRAALPDIEEEFANVAIDTPYGKGPLTWNGAGEAVLFATGRRNVESLHAFFHFAPYHDPLYLLAANALPSIIGLGGENPQPLDRSTLTITLTLPQTPENLLGIFAVCNKSVLRETRSSKRFDMTFTKLSEADNAAAQRKLDNRWAIMSENGDIADAYLGEVNEKGQAQRERIGIQHVLDETKAGNWLESLVISDQPTEKPVGPLLNEDKPRKIILTLRLPSTTASARETLPLLGLALDLADAIGLATANSATAPLKFRADTLSKLKRTRAEVNKQLLEESTREAREAEKEAKADAKAKADREKLEKLTPAEQERRKEIERKRQMKKTVKTMKR